MLLISAVTRYLIAFQPIFITRNKKKEIKVFTAGFRHKIIEFKAKTMSFQNNLLLDNV